MEQELDRDLAAELRVAREEDLAHAAARDLADQPEAIDLLVLREVERAGASRGACGRSPSADRASRTTWPSGWTIVGSPTVFIGTVGPRPLVRRSSHARRAYTGQMLSESARSTGAGREDLGLDAPRARRRARATSRGRVAGERRGRCRGGGPRRSARLA